MEDQESLPIAVRRPKHQIEPVNYKEEDFVKLPKAEYVKQPEKLYPVTVTEEKSEKTELWSRYTMWDSLVTGMSGDMKKNWKAKMTVTTA